MAEKRFNPLAWLFSTTPALAEPDPEDPKYLVEGEYTLGSSDRYRQDQQHYASLQAEKLKQQQHKAEAIYKQAKDTADTIQKSKISIGSKVGKDDKIFGSITTLQISDGIKKATGISIERKKITLDVEIKKIGTYKASVQLHKELTIEIDFEVESE